MVLSVCSAGSVLRLLILLRVTLYLRLLVLVLALLRLNEASLLCRNLIVLIPLCLLGLILLRLLRLVLLRLILLGLVLLLLISSRLIIHLLCGSTVVRSPLFDLSGSKERHEEKHNEYYKADADIL